MCNNMELFELKLYLKAQRDPEVTKFFYNYFFGRQD